MQVYDIVMLTVLGLCTLFGMWKGMAWQVASLSSLIVSYFVALMFSDALASQFNAEPPLNRIAAMLVLYLVTSLCIWILFRVVASIIDRVKLKEFDKQIGALFGAAKGVLLCVLITFFAVMLSTSSREAVLQSQSGHYIALLIDRVDPILPTDVHQVLHPYLNQLDEQLDPGNAPDEPRPLDGVDFNALRQSEDANRW